MKTYIRQNTWLSRGLTDFGWGNGYVLIPEGHPLHGKSYDEIPVDVHGGLTFSDSTSNICWPDLNEEEAKGWVVGFDTAHGGDTLEYWTKEKVQEETDHLAKQLQAY